ncbi:M23 family metallopeptidase [Hydrogenophilus thiooxidans]|uniref:M23 family metallopeptidase n=1 Tax=Hydrogenophilus thiooxidans TaxID=2820326 RepID=UPI001C232412|nr:M23 family metallopeptidase [Hydrogenophilus thiooxidans]
MKRTIWLRPPFWFALSGAFVTLGLAVAAIDPNRTAPSPQEVIASLPPISLHPAAEPSLPPVVIRDRVQQGETLSELLERIGANDPELIDYALAAPEAQPIHRRLLGNGTVTLKLDPTGKVFALQLPLTHGERVTIERDGDRFAVKNNADSSDTTTFLEAREGVISSSLFATADEIGLPYEIASRLAEVFGTEIDFSRDLRVGDAFVVLYETSIDALGNKTVGDIVAAEFTNQGKTYRVLRYTNRDGETGFYTPDGKALGSGFLRYPLKFTRVTSQFGLREHPVTGGMKNHYGVDLAAATGTPVLAASDGRVTFLGWKGGYGKLVILAHRNGYETRYGHLSAYANGLAPGQKVQQGQVIAYSGATGRVTGPHLHYEVRIGGKPYNPQTVRLPGPEPLPKAELARFLEQTRSTLTQLAAVARRPELVATQQRAQPSQPKG